MQRAGTTHRRGVKFCETRIFDESTPYGDNQTIIDAQQHVAVEVDVWDLTLTVLVCRRNSSARRRLIVHVRP